MSKQQSEAKAAVETVIGKRYGPYHAWHPVSAPMIWQWVSAFGDKNPLYSDAGFARSAGFRDIISPPAMVQGWCLPNISRQYPPRSAKERPYTVLDLLTEHGFPGNVAVAYDQRFLKPVQLGDVLHFFVEPTDVSEEKKTRLGTGHFITCLEEYINQDGDVVYESRTSYFNFKGGEPGNGSHADAARSPGGTVNPPEAYESEAEWRDRKTIIEPGADIGELHIPITSSRIVVCALASLDWMTMHHSRESAMAQGQPDIFMNILTTGGFIGRFLTDWAGPGSTLRSVKFSLGVPNYPGDHMVLTGNVSGLRSEDGTTLVDVAYQGKNKLGPHVTGSAIVELHNT